MGSFTVSHAFRRISCADQTGFACEERAILPIRENSLPILGAGRPNISLHRSAPRRVGPCWPHCFSTNSAGSQNQCLGLRAWAEETSLAEGSQTVSTTQIRITGNCVGKRTQNCRKAAHQPSASLCFSCLCAIVTSACEYVDNGAPGKVSTQLRAKHQKSAHSSTRVTSWILCPIAVSWVRNQQVQGLNVDARRRLRTEPPREEHARKGRPLGTQHGRARHDPRGPCGVPRSQRDRAPSFASADCFRTPALANAAGGAALRNGTDVANVPVVSTKHKVAGVPRNNQLPTSHHFLATTSSPHSTPLSMLNFCPSTAQFPQNWSTCRSSSATWQHFGASALMAGHRRGTFAHMRPTEQPRSFALMYNEKTSRSGVIPKKHAACGTSAESAGSDDRRPVLQRGSVLQQSGTKLAAMATRSVAVQTEDPICGALSLWDWLTPATVSSTATQTLDDVRSLHQWRSIQGQYWVELQEVQHSIRYALNKRRDSG